MNAKVGVVALVGFAAAGGIGWAVWSKLHDHPAEGLTLYGNVDIREVDLGFQVPGRLVQVAFDEGDHVKAGAVVARLDDTSYREALAAADARVQQAQAELDKLEAGSRPQQIREAHAHLAQAQATLAHTEQDLRRYRALGGSGAVSQQVLDAAEARHDEAAAALSQARSALSLARAGARSQDIEAGKAQLAAAEADRNQAATRLADTILHAPSDGIVVTRAREPGSILAQGETVCTLSLRNPFYVRAYVSEPDLGKVAPGTPVTVTTDASKKIYHGTIGFVSPRAEFTPKSVETTALRTDLVYRLRIVVRDADERLRQGMPVTVHVGKPASHRTKSKSR